MRKLYFSHQKRQTKKTNKDKNDRVFSLASKIVYWLPKNPCFEFFGGGKYGLFWAKMLMEIYLLVTVKFCVKLFRDGKYGLFWGEMLM